MSTNSAVRVKAERWKALFNEAIDYFLAANTEGQDGTVENPVESLYASVYLGGLANIMKKDQAETVKRLAVFNLRVAGTHPDTVDATSYRASVHAITNMQAVNNLVQQEVSKTEGSQSIVAPPPSSGNGIDSWEETEEPTKPSMKAPTVLPVIFQE
jgi:hypothetical protein